jgi:hypothetical protein
MHLASIMCALNYASHHIHHDILHQSYMHQTMHHIVFIVTYLNVHHAYYIKHACITLASKQCIKLHSLWHVLTYHSCILHHICVSRSTDLPIKVKLLSPKVQYSLASAKSNAHWHSPRSPISIGTRLSPITMGINKGPISIGTPYPSKA